MTRILVFLWALFVPSIFPAIAGINSWTRYDENLATNFSFPLPLALAINPSNASQVFIGKRSQAATGNVYRTGDGGATWTNVFTHQYEVLDIAIDPSTPSTLYVGTDNSISSGAGLYKSTDSGNTWALKNLGLVNAIPGGFSRKIAVDPLASSRVYVAMSDGVFKSENGGEVWTLIDTPTAPKSAETIALDSNGTMYVAGRSASNLNFQQIFRSTDFGATWTKSGPDLGSVRAILVDPAVQSTIYVASQLFNSGAVLLKSIDSGATWSSLDGTGLAVFDGIAAIPGTPSVLVVAGPKPNCGAILRSLDGGQSWQDVSAGMPTLAANCQYTVTRMATSAASPNLIIANSAGQSTYQFTHDPTQIAPFCTLSANPLVVSSGGSSTLTATCNPSATSYVWSSNAGISPTSSVGTVSPTQNTTYTVQGVNSAGTGNVASVTVGAPTPRLVNLSTRMQVLTGNDVMIGGFIIGGTASKTVVVRARGPSLIPLGVVNALADPTLQLFSGQSLIGTNDDWGLAPNSAAIQSSGFAPSDAKEAAILMSLGPGAYTAVVRGTNNQTGVGIVEVFEVDGPEVPLANISTRGQVLTGDDVMIGGFIVQGNSPQTVIVRARGPTLAQFGISNFLANPVLQLYSGQTVIASNDDWIAASNAAEIQSRGFAPGNTREAAILITLNPGAYTAVVTGANGTTGVGIVEVFAQ